MMGPVDSEEEEKEKEEEEGWEVERGMAAFGVGEGLVAGTEEEEEEGGGEGLGEGMEGMEGRREVVGVLEQEEKQERMSLLLSILCHPFTNRCRRRRRRSSSSSSLLKEKEQGMVGVLPPPLPPSLLPPPLPLLCQYHLREGGVSPLPLPTSLPPRPPPPPFPVLLLKATQGDGPAPHLPSHLPSLPQLWLKRVAGVPPVAWLLLL